MQNFVCKTNNPTLNKLLYAHKNVNKSLIYLMFKPIGKILNAINKSLVLHTPNNKKF